MCHKCVPGGQKLIYVSILSDVIAIYVSILSDVIVRLLLTNNIRRSLKVYIV